MRLYAYAGASTALASAVLLRAFTERPNFYSAAVYLGQSSACNLILMNFLLLSAGSTVFGLQRLLYGPLRPIEIEQLWDKGWYAVTETALAMTTFRDEVGGWFFILFMSLLAGKVWNWIGDGRIEILEQQPPANPRLFHARLIASLLVSEIFDALMLQYCIHTLQEQPRPGMMVMFAFEFAVLLISSTSSLARYSISAYEIYVEQQQRKVRNEERREELRAARQTAEGTATDASNVIEPDVDEEDVDVPGWQEKGLYILFLDLTTDFLKLILYAGFFTILLIFSGIPIHMFRDLFITLRSFLKRINDYLKYRNATKDMNSRYPDATAQDLERDDTCIICREDMHVWQQPNANARPSRNPPDERQRPKKLPCGHILHVGCLRSWLERQQVCPVCRASVLGSGSGNTTTANHHGGNQADQQAPGPAGDPQPGQPPQQQAQQPQQPPGHAPRDAGPAAPRPRNFRARTFGFGNFRMTLGIGNGAAPGANAIPAADGDPHQILDQALDRYRRIMDEARHRRRADRSNERAGDSIQAQLVSIERRITEDINSLQNVQHQMSAVRALQAQLEQLRSLNDHPPPQATGPAQVDQGQPPLIPNGSMLPLHQMMLPLNGLMQPGGPVIAAGLQRTGPVLTPGHPDLPTGLVLPGGWTATSMARPSAQRVPSRALGPDDLVEQVSLPQQRPQSQQRTTANSETGGSAGETSQPEATTSVTLPNEASSSSSHEARNPENGSTVHPGHISLPAWGSNETTTDTVEASANGHAANGHAANGDNGTESSHESPSANEPPVADKGKGKGKVATVEDGEESGAADQ